MSSRNLISGFRNTGIWPLDLSRILNDLEAVMEDAKLPAVTPLALSPKDLTLTTPRKSRDIRKAYEMVL